MYIAVSFEARGNFFPRKKKGALSSDEQGVRWVRATARRGEPPTSARANGSPSAWCFWRQITTVDDGDHGERSARGRALFPPSGAASCWRLDAARAPAIARAVPKPPIAFGAAGFLPRAASLSCSAGGLRSFPSEK
jgi:hypothetical protein|eukprot:COSAG06_NODE_324_length_17552_cov_11.946370_12_plen_136_part_00